MNDSITFWNIIIVYCSAFSVLVNRFMQISNNSVSKKRVWSIQNLIFSKTRNGLKHINLNRLLFIYINERILNRSIGSSHKKLSYTHDVLISNEILIELKDLMLQNDNDNGFVIMKEGEDEDLTMKDPEE